jgi:hypothetical protein
MNGRVMIHDRVHGLPKLLIKQPIGMLLRPVRGKNSEDRELLSLAITN